ncbi:short-chain dehydrogenase [Endozoicomonas sp. OPT23]|uniref:SDR family oxidoreductase n=1 Tax=Endozoicomonas sp. OPT23 TaxID=2072845 RepID=UPI00129B414C|nr:SDR family oxidoreductase [Endozoicomonas sp. OPT23]MRI32616.1 short-chain dehydrogenase [Endozoicomonas sp. OPT23]
MNNQKNALITGCSTGIGRRLALELHARGYKVWATARNPESLIDLETIGIVSALLDVNDQDQIDELAGRILSYDGRLDLLVNNAGYGSMGPLIETPVKELQQQFATNVISPMALAQAFAPAMIQKKAGTIVNIGSVSGVCVTPFSGTYCASKAAINTLSDCLRMELAPFGIRVMTVHPGAIQSDFARNANAALERVWSDSSLYKGIESAVRKRANASQKNPTSTEKFCRNLVDNIEDESSSSLVRLGNGSLALTLLGRFIPFVLREKILSSVFSLNKLKRG